jgi:cytochrome c553
LSAKIIINQPYEHSLNKGKIMFKLLVIFLLIFTSNPSQASEDDTAIKIIEAKCKLCHGLDGEASSAIYPRLAAQHENYIIKQLHDFRSGKRKGTMNEMATGLTDAQISDLAKYFSSKPALSHRVRNKEFAAVGQYIFHKGNKYSGVAACASCHGEKGEGTNLLPRLAGQHKRYVADQLHEFHERKRTNDNAIMATIASRLTEMEIEAVANYVSGLGFID